ncbi:hypothetical protein ElyMa_001062600 [Elysia marginata]|uniref:Uncharacterized protein n=1 Tax=Elysia marginata TaxID=1093978 RepID=A0AAV4HSR3_9GAST|nr:hypothetical protein ElyMa_001062600 [Elysia marginata]
MTRQPRPAPRSLKACHRPGRQSNTAALGKAKSQQVSEMRQAIFGFTFKLEDLMNLLLEKLAVVSCFQGLLLRGLRRSRTDLGTVDLGDQEQISAQLVLFSSSHKSLPSAAHAA